ncbi:unnamed protein product [Phytophthora fragariaefolia]|uniref:Unnamed protein product n=1 Tax=Phytophthora fragariaefolia TaxID=1490495 RepID=A0A9W6XG20_9STRA|nr:unnamed protein product [Phytophthora fragariaefolia]
MASSPVPGDLAFIGPKHAAELTDFQYVELEAHVGGEASVKVVGPNGAGDERSLSIPWATFCRRVVPAQERDLWPGSFIAHPVAFVLTSEDGVDEWAYGIVSGYTATPETTLHLIHQHGSTRLPLPPTTAVIKADVLNYVLQTGGGVNIAGLSPMELIVQQNEVIAACRRRRSGLPKSVTKNLSVPYKAAEVVPLINPATLQLVRVRRQHVVDYKTAAASKRPSDLYSDTGAGTTLERMGPNSVAASRTTGRRRPATDAISVSSDLDVDTEPLAIESDDADAEQVRHIHRPLAKRRRVEIRANYPSLDSSDASSYSADSSSSDDDGTNRFSSSRERGVVFHPSPTERQVHVSIVQQRHAGKVAQTLLQSAQQTQHLDFIGTPPVLRGAYHFGFGLGLSIMHFRRAITSDEFATTESAVNMSDFSSKNALPTPPKATGLGDLVSALSAFYKFAKYFYNKDTKRFIGAARDFIIAYADKAPSDAATARLLTHWVNIKFGKFRSLLVSKGLKSALRVRKQFCRNDDQLVALKESYPAWTATAQSAGRIKTTYEGSGNAPRQFDRRPTSKTRIPNNVLTSLPKSEDGRRLCLRFVSKAGCNLQDCPRPHFKPQALSDEAKAVVNQRWNGLSTECKDL